MATDVRKMSESGYYHAIARGNGRQLIFEDDDDGFSCCKNLRRFSRKSISLLSRGV